MTGQAVGVAITVHQSLQLLIMNEFTLLGQLAKRGRQSSLLTQNFQSKMGSSHELGRSFGGNIKFWTSGL